MKSYHFPKSGPLTLLLELIVMPDPLCLDHGPDSKDVIVADPHIPDPTILLPLVIDDHPFLTKLRLPDFLHLPR